MIINYLLNVIYNMKIKIQKECVLCNIKYQWNQIMYTKLPENVSFCEKCFNRFTDTNKYTWNECWIVTEWNPEILFYNDTYETHRYKQL